MDCSAKQFLPAENIHAADPLAARLVELNERYGVTAFPDNVSAVRGADLVLLAVKPQKLDKVLYGLRNLIPEEALVLSIIAGATIQTISEGLNHDADRPRHAQHPGPNWTRGSLSGHPALPYRPTKPKLARQVLSALGQEIYMEEEYYLDMATALSGTGPGYVFLFMEALIDAGVHMGFPRRISEQLVTQTILGSVSYYEKIGIHPAQLRNQVTSPGGTTAEALYYLDKAGFRTAISRAVWAAYRTFAGTGQRSEQQTAGKNLIHPDQSFPSWRINPCLQSTIESIGKIRGLQQCATPQTAIAVLALDHRNNLRNALNPADPGSVSNREMSDFKIEVIQSLAAHSSAVLLDPQVGAAQCIAAGALPGSTGLVISVEATGYTGDPGARISQILSDWSVAEIRRMGASAVKLLVYYHPDAPTAAEIEALVRTVAADCQDADIPFFSEPLSYSLRSGSQKTYPQPNASGWSLKQPGDW